MIGGHLLVVCTGNVCRSPYVEHRLRHELGGTGISVASAGTDALVAEPMAETTALLLRERGVDPDAFRARQVSPAVLRSADLVLTATRAHRGAVAAMAPQVLRRAFTLRQLARLLRAAPPGTAWPVRDLPELVSLASAARGAAGPASDDDDVVDPWQRPGSVYRRMVEQVEPALTPLLLALRDPDREPDST